MLLGLPTRGLGIVGGGEGEGYCDHMIRAAAVVLSSPEQQPLCDCMGGDSNSSSTRKDAGKAGS
jgi:hypothetical protein